MLKKLEYELIDFVTKNNILASILIPLNRSCPTKKFERDFVNKNYILASILSFNKF